MPEDLGYACFPRTIKRLIGVNLEQYRRGQMRRRLDALLQQVGVADHLAYA